MKTKARLVFNLFVVWTLTGMWHGAQWQFIVWGLLYFVLLTFEKLLGIPQWLKTSKPWQSVAYRVLTLFAVMFGWVLFRADGLKAGLIYIKAMLTPIGMQIFVDNSLLRIVHVPKTIVWHSDIYWLLGSFLAGVVFATPLMKLAGGKLSAKLGKQGIAANYALSLVLFILSVAVIIASNYNPFIYFNF